MHSSSSSSSEDAEDESSPASSVSVGCSRPRSLAQSASLRAPAPSPRSLAVRIESRTRDKSPPAGLTPRGDALETELIDGDARGESDERASEARPAEMRAGTSTELSVQLVTSRDGETRDLVWDGPRAPTRMTGRRRRKPRAGGDGPCSRGTRWCIRARSRARRGRRRGSAPGEWAFDRGSRARDGWSCTRLADRATPPRRRPPRARGTPRRPPPTVGPIRRAWGDRRASRSRRRLRPT